MSDSARRPTQFTSGPPPKGRVRWTLKLLADRLVESKVVDAIGAATIQRTLKLIPAAPGRPERTDYEYERNGTANLFMISEPLARICGAESCIVISSEKSCSMQRPKFSRTEILTRA